MIASFHRCHYPPPLFFSLALAAISILSSVISLFFFLWEIQAASPKQTHSANSVVPRHWDSLSDQLQGPAHSWQTDHDDDDDIDIDDDSYYPPMD